MILLFLSVLTLIVASFIDGAVEGFEFDERKFFERRYNVNPYGFWGSKSWKKAQTNPNLYNKINGVFDFYHVCDDLRKYGYIGGSILFALTAEKLFLYLIITLILTIAAKRLGMYLIRKKYQKL